MGFNDQVTVHKGDIGERIVAQRMHDRGWQGWRSIETEEAHPWDFSWHKRNTFEGKIIEVKTHTKRRLYNDNGFDVKNYIIYQRVDAILPVEILWVDADEGKIYGNTLKELIKPYYEAKSGIDYPLQQGEQIYFCMDSMILFDKLTESEIDLIKKA